jgi:hypothetical protein
MPILSPEPNVHPADLFDGNGPAAAEHVWWVLHTLPRQEKSLARQLLRDGLPFYLPLRTRRGVIRGAVVESRLPLFTGYLFLLAGPGQREAALATHRVARAIPVHEQDALWRDLRQVHLLLKSGLPVTPEEKLGPGTPVEILSGPLAGMRGTVQRAAGGKRFFISVDFIQQGASVQIDDFALAALAESTV